MRPKFRFLTTLGIGLRESHMNEEALTYFDNALKIASTIPDIGYPFSTKEALLRRSDRRSNGMTPPRSWPTRFWRRRSSDTTLRPRQLC